MPLPPHHQVHIINDGMQDAIWDAWSVEDKLGFLRAELKTVRRLLDAMQVLSTGDVMLRKNLTVASGVDIKIQP